MKPEDLPLPFSLIMSTEIALDNVPTYKERMTIGEARLRQEISDMQWRPIIEKLEKQAQQVVYMFMYKISNDSPNEHQYINYGFRYDPEGVI